MISFIIPTLSEEKYIGKTLSYISKYTGDHEIIVSDTNSKDKTVEIARQYTDKIVIHSKEGKKLTIAAGRNLGASIAKGEYLVFLDADTCIFNPDDFFGRAINFFTKDDKLVAMTCKIRVLKESETFSDKVFTEFFVLMRLIMNNYLGLGAATGEFQMIRTDAFKKVGGFDESFVIGEDDDMFRRLSKIGKTRLETSLVANHSGRRAHAVGWIRLICIWTIYSLPILFFKKSFIKEWKEVR